MQVKWLRGALCNLGHEAACIARGSPLPAAALVAEVDASTRLLAHHPDMGRAGGVPGTRELVLPQFPTSFLIVSGNSGLRLFACFIPHENGRRGWKANRNRNTCPITLSRISVLLLPCNKTTLYPPYGRKNNSYACCPGPGLDNRASPTNTFPCGTALQSFEP